MRQRIPRLDTVTNLLTMAVLLFFVTLIAQKEYFPDWGRQVGPRTGLQLPPISGVNFADSNKTLLVAATAGCKYCRASVPFYKQLSERSKSGGKTKVVFVFPNGDIAFEQFLRENRLSSVPHFAVNMQQLFVTGTPAYIIVNRNGRVERMWSGKLAEARENEILRILSLGLT